MLGYGYYGVDLFFVISGFIIYFAFTRRPVTWQTFASNRLTRIVPLYWLFTGLMLALMLAVPGQFATRFSPDMALRSPGFVAFTTGGEPLISPGWTLEYEMAFYLLPPLSIGFGMATWTLLPCALAGLAMVVLALGSNADAQPGDRVLVAALGESRLEGEGWLRWLVARLGDASYAIYLVQVFPLSAIYKVTKHLVPAMPFAPMVLIETEATIAIAIGLGAAKTVAAQPGS